MEPKSEPNEFRYETYQHENLLQNQESDSVEVGEFKTSTNKKNMYRKLSLVFLVCSFILVSVLLFARSSTKDLNPNSSFKKQVSFTSKSYNSPTKKPIQYNSAAHTQPSGH